MGAVCPAVALSRQPSAATRASPNGHVLWPCEAVCSRSKSEATYVAYQAQQAPCIIRASPTDLIKRSRTRCGAGVFGRSMIIRWRWPLRAGKRRPERFAAERARVREQVLADLRAVHGPGFGHSFGGRWAVRHETHQRFCRYLGETLGINSPARAGGDSVVHSEATQDVEV